MSRMLGYEKECANGKEGEQYEVAPRARPTILPIWLIGCHNFLLSITAIISSQEARRDNVFIMFLLLDCVCG